jgi:hypothetical protein
MKFSRNGVKIIKHYGALATAGLEGRDKPPQIN